MNRSPSQKEAIPSNSPKPTLICRHGDGTFKRPRVGTRLNSTFT